MNGDHLLLILLTVITAATPLLFAALGELITEKSGVLNLGVEGMMLTGAVCGFATVHLTGSAILACVVGMLAAVLLSLVFSVLALSLQANQMATGLALTIFGIGLSALLGKSLVGVPYEGLPALNIPLLADIPVIGPLLFQHNLLVYLSFGMVFLVSYFLYHTRAGLVLRAVGDSHHAAHAMGYSVVRVRYLAALFGGAMAGLGGVYISLAYSPMWSENMIAGRGWIALALVVFATWRPMRVFVGAYLFGGISILQLHGQAIGIDVPSQVMSMLPYLATVVVLVMISRDRHKIKVNAPACIGRAFHPDR